MSFVDWCEVGFIQATSRTAGISRVVFIMLLGPELTADKPPDPVFLSTWNLDLAFLHQHWSCVWCTHPSSTPMAVSHKWESDSSGPDTDTPQGTGDDTSRRSGHMSGKENAASGHSHNTRFSSWARGPEQCQSHHPRKATPKAAHPNPRQSTPAKGSN